MLKVGSFRNVCVVGALLLIGGGARAASTADTKAADSSEGKPEVLVITAERRSTDLQNTGVSASVLTSEDLVDKSVYGLTALQYAVPSVTISDYGSANVFNIRGIGRSQVDVDLPSGVVIYFDGAPTIAGYFQNEPFFDLANVEVLRGPQGTFAGQSAAGGALFVTTHDPELGKQSGEVSIGGGSFGAGEFTGVLNVPVGDDLAFRFSAHHEQRDDYHDRISGDYTGNPGQRNLNSIRFAMLWQPEDMLDVLFKVDYSNLNFGGNAVTSYGYDLMEPTNQDANFKYTDKSTRGVLKLDLHFDTGITLTSLSGAQHLETVNNLDANGSNAGMAFFDSKGDINIYSQEIDLISPADATVRWVLGAFALRQQIDIPSWPQYGFTFTGFGFGENFPFFTSNWNQQQTNYAGFAHVAYNITSALEIEAGVRYGQYLLKQSTNWMFGFGFDPPAPIGFEPQQNLHEFDLDGTIGLNYTLSQNQFLYGLVSFGTVTGGINLFPAAGGFNEYDPMNVTNYEMGWKATWFDGQLRTQFDGYYDRFQNYQAAFGQEIPGGGTFNSVSTFRNADGNSDIWGFEFTSQAVFGNLAFDIGVAYLDSELGTFENVIDPFLPGPPPANVIDLSGAHSPFSPKWTANVGVGYSFHLGEMTVTPRVDYAYIDSTQAGLWNSPQIELDSRKLTNVQVRAEVRNWWASLWCTNATDEKYANAIQNIPPIFYAAPPRMFGVRAGMNF